MHIKQGNGKIATVKELDSHAKHDKRLKNRVGSMTIFLCQIHSFRILKVFFSEYGPV